jgi:outer membrane protein assembly factor BamB
MKYYSKVLVVGALSGLLCACNGFFDKDNTPTPSPLVKFQPEAKATMLWHSHINFGVGDDYLKLVPVMTEDSLYTASRLGEVAAIDKQNGKVLWTSETHTPLSAGPATDKDLVFIGGRSGKVLALRQSDGKIVWTAQAPTEILSPPAANDGYVLIKTIDGQLTAFAETDGHVLWHYQQTEPNLILRSGSTPQIDHDVVVVGFANGNLAKLTLKGGNLLWQTTVGVPQGSFAIQRMVDIDADPVIFNRQLYVATYQGRIAALELSSGKEIWTHDISSFTGLNLDQKRVYVSDASGQLWAFDKESGHVAWRQTELENRNITGPAVMANYVIVGDGEGYIHWMNKQDGHFVARTRIWGSAILATPVVDNNQIAYVLTKDGYLAAFKLA